jgi:hypothetical protein
MQRGGERRKIEMEAVKKSLRGVRYAHLESFALQLQRDRAQDYHVALRYTMTDVTLLASQRRRQSYQYAIVREAIVNLIMVLHLVLGYFCS